MSSDSDPQFTLRLSLEDTQAILAALGRLSYQEVADLIHRIAGQLNPQLLAHQEQIALATAAAGELRN